MEVIYKRQPKHRAPQAEKEREDRFLFNQCPHCCEPFLCIEYDQAKIVYIYMCASNTRMFYRQKNWSESTYQSTICKENVINGKVKK